tara:strand:+ start:271 stop:1110 length:840 start_codon:yes stop_codon:yes gene_type:complete
MRNLIQLVLHYRITLLFIALEAIGFILLVNYNSHQEISFLASTTEISGKLNQEATEVSDYFSLKETNEILANENVTLRNMMRENYLQAGEGFKQFVDTNYMQLYNYREAKIVSSTVNKRNNYAIINRGASHGIKKDMGVISSNGVLGIVKETSSHFATVMTVLHSRTQVSTRFQKNAYFGILTWQGYDPEHATLNDIPSHVQLKEGDTLITRGASGIFPEGTLVGTIESWEEVPSTNFYEINVKLSTNFRNTEYVYVIDNLRKGEFMQLLENTEEENAN